MRGFRWMAVLLALVCVASTAVAAPVSSPSRGPSSPDPSPALQPMIQSPKVPREGLVLVDAVRTPEAVGVTPIWKGPVALHELPSQFIPRASNGRVSPDGLSWFGYYQDYVSNSIAMNNHYADLPVAFRQLGKGVCMEEAEKLSVSGSINFGGSAKFSDVISTSLGFQVSGTREFTTTYKFCGPSDSSDKSLRTFYRQFIYDLYNSAVTRCWWVWPDLRYVGCEDTYYRTEDVPYLSIWSEDQ